MHGHFVDSRKAIPTLYPKGERPAFGVETTGTDQPEESHTEMVNTPAPPIRTRENVDATRSIPGINSTRTTRLASGPMEQNLHANGTVTGFAFGVGITSLSR